MNIQEMTVEEIDEVSGGRIDARRVLWGMLAGMVGTGLTLAGLGTPISIAGGALAVEGATMVAIGLVA